MEFIFWCEFPKQVDWKKLQKILKDINLKLTVYIAVHSPKDFINWKKKIKKETPNIKNLYAWPVLKLKDGYWFSGFTSKENITKLQNFKGLNIKLDLEPPFPGKGYHNLKIALYILKWITRKAPNTKLLIKTVQDLSHYSHVLVNELPLPEFILKRSGLHIPKSRNISKNIMTYSSFGEHLRYLLKICLKFVLKQRLRKDKNISCSLGIAGPGIFGNEPFYKSLKEFKKDIQDAKKLGIKRCAVYSIESFLNRRNPNAWFSAVKEFSQ